MHPDPDILEIEQRLTRRRTEIDLLAHESGRRAMRALASPAMLATVVALGFLVGAGVTRRPAAPVESKGSAAKKTGVAGLLMSGALWLIREQFGSPAQIAQLILSRMKNRPPSPQGDSRTYHSPRYR